jgi:succinyl-diaminopimelate desuccinylase
LYGRGIVDDKGPAVACVYAMKDLLDAGVPLKRRVRILFGLAEEGGDWSDLDYYRQTQEAPVCGFTPDGRFPVIHGEKGFSAYLLSMPLAASGVELLEGGQAENMVPDFCRAVVNGQAVETRGRSCHGSKPWEGENAISKLMEQLSGLPVAELYNRCIGYDLYGQRLGCQVEDDKVGRLTVNVGKVRTQGDRVVFWLDIRYPTVITSQDLLERLSQAVAPYGGTVELDYAEDPVYFPLEDPLIVTLMDAYRAVTGDADAQPVLMTGGTYAKAMERIAVFGPVFPGREPTEHQKNERMVKEDLFLARRIYQEAMARLANL